MNHTHTNTLVRAKRILALVLAVALCMNNIGNVGTVHAITYDAATSTYFDSIDDFGLSTGSDSIGLQFGGTLGEYLRFNQATGRFVFTDDLDVQGTISGSRLTIMGSASISGTLTLEGGGAALSGSALRGFGLMTDCDTAGTSKLLWDATEGRFSCGTDTDTDTNTTYTAGQGLNLSTTSFRLNTTVTGAVIQAANSLASSGALSWKGTATGSILNAGGGSHTVSASGASFFNTSTKNVDFAVFGRTNNALFYVDASGSGTAATASGGVGIGTRTPVTQLHVAGRVPTVQQSLASLGTAPMDVEIQGKTAYLVDQSNNLKIVDVSNASSPVVKSTLATGLTTLVDVAVQGSYAYVPGALTFKIIDVSNPASPYVVSTGPSVGGAASYVAVSGPYLYMTDAAGVLTTVDISNPQAAVITSTVSSVGGKITIDGNYLYMVEAGTIRIFNLRNPAAPFQQGTVSVTNASHIAVQGRYAYVSRYSSSAVSVVDVSDPANPVAVGSVSVGNTPQHIAVSGRYAFVTDFLDSKLHVLDISSPVAPRVLGSVATGGTTPYTVTVSGRYAYIANRDSSNMSIFDLGGAYIQQLEAGGAEIGALTVRTDFDAADASIRGGLSAGRLFVFGNMAASGALKIAQGFSAGSGNVLFSRTGSVVFNEQSRDVDLRIEGDTDANLAFFDASLDSVGIGTAAPKAKLAVAGTISGVTLYATKSFSGAGLTDCDTEATQKLAWDATTGRFSCLADQTGGSSGGGMAYSTASGIFLKRSGGTMTGTLTIQNGNTPTSTLTPLLNVRGTMSGRGLYLSGTGANQAPLLATNLSYGTLLMGTGSMKAGSGSFTPQLYVAGRKPVQVGTGTLANGPTGMAIQGKILYVTRTSTLEMVDVSNPTHPAILGSVTTGVIASPGPVGVAVQGNYAYVANSSERNLHVIDVSNPAAPFRAGSGASLSNSTFMFPVVSGRFAYVLDNASNSRANLVIFDISNPVRPVMVGSGATGSLGSFGRRIFVQGRYAYVANLTDATMKVLDISNSAAPVIVGSIATGTDPYGLYVQGRYAYVVANGQPDMRIFDVINPASPVLVGTASSLIAGNSPSDVFVQGRYAYVTSQDGLHVIDVSAPRAPKRFATTAHSGIPVFLTAQGRYAYVASAGGGVNLVSIFDLGGSYIQQLEAGGAEIGSLSVRNKFDAVDGTFKGALSASSFMVNGFIGLNSGTGTTGFLMNGGTFLLTPGQKPSTMSGIDLNANVNAVFITGNYAYTVSDSVTGNEYRAIDIANPNAPVIVGGFDTGQNTKALFVSTRHTFIGMNGSGAGSGMYILDNGNPGTPTVVGRINFGWAVNSIYVSGKYAYVALNAATSGVCMAKYQLYSGCDFAIVDFTDANRPKIIGGLQIGANVNQMHIQNRYAYLAIDSVSGNDFRIIDIANPLAPIAVGGLDVSNNVKSVYASGKYAFIGLSTDASTEFRVVDVSNKTSPVSIGGIEAGAAVQSIIVTGDWARIGLSSVAGNDMYNVDLRTPTTPRLYGGVDFGAGVNEVMVAGKYGYVGLSSVSGNDFRIIDLAGIDTPSATIGSLSTGHLFASDNVRFDNNAYIRNALNVGRGGIISKGALSVQSTGTGSSKGGTGTLLNAFDVRNGTGQHLFSVSENGVVQGGIPSFATGTTMLAMNFMSRRTGQCVPLITSATTYTSVGMSTCTVNGTATTWPGGNRMKIKMAAANTASAMAGITTVFTETKQTFRPKIGFDITTGTGTTGLRFYGGIVESSTAALALSVPAAATTIDYAALAWEDGISGTQWMCCSGDGTNHSCTSMGVAVQTSTEYIGFVDWSQAGKVSCSLQVRDKTYRVTKTTNVSVQSVALGENVVLVNKSIAGATARVVYVGKLMLEQN